jgi:hypothetical protein
MLIIPSFISNNALPAVCLSEQQASFSFAVARVQVENSAEIHDTKILGDIF